MNLSRAIIRESSNEYYSNKVFGFILIKLVSWILMMILRFCCIGEILKLLRTFYSWENDWWLNI